ncbi:MAG: nitrous oxide-stimulated promoter family protein [Fenollaria timonensis]
MIKEKTFPILKNKIPIDKDKEAAKKLFEKKIFLLMAAIYCEDMISGSKKSISKYKFEENIDEFILNRPKLWKYKINDTCYELIMKAFRHTERCPHSFYKTFCHQCPTTCYKLTDLEQIEPIMKYAGRKIILKHPIMGLKFVINLIRSKNLINKNKDREN